MIGDGFTDIEAGGAAGTRTVFIGQSKPYIFEAFEKHGIQPDFITLTLARRFHRLGGRCVRSDSGCEFPHCNSAYRSFPSASVAPVSLASEA
jgi:hypothetical protein